MAVAKIAITLDNELLHKIDYLVKSNVYANRSKAIQEAIEEKMLRYDRSRLAHECAKLDIREEQKLAEQGLASEVTQWPSY